LARNEDELGNYCAAGLKELLTQCEEIEVLQLRVNHEAGVGDQNTNEIFWKKLIAATSEVSRKVKLDLRAKGLTDGMIQYALEKGLELAVPTKHWCEHIALPYHLSQMRNEELTRLYNLNHSRRYSYADMLKRPRNYDIIYRLWNYGSNTLFLFGDPDYARRFTYSINYGQAVGFEITAPLTLKGGMSSIEGEPWPIFDDPELMYSKWEDERYWAWYLVFGRLGYSMDTCPEVWKREFRAHFGKAARIEIRDRGCGIPDVRAARQPLFTPDPAGERSGMGFTVMESFMDKLRVSSKVGKGTNVIMFKHFNGRSENNT
jgi:hypothetical protein